MMPVEYLILILLISAFAVIIITYYLQPSHKKKILIFMTRSGGGQTTITEALSQSLNNSYHIITNDVFTQTLISLDFLAQLTNNSISGVDLYNQYLLKYRSLWGFSRIFYQLGNWRFGTKSTSAAALIQQYIASVNPDMIVSVVPIVNNAILTSCKTKNIPFLLVSADLDPYMYIDNLENPDYEKFKVAIPFSDNAIQEKITAARIPTTNVIISGYPLRNNFFSPKNIPVIKNEWNIPENKPVVLVMLGSIGASTMPDIARQLAQVSIPAHVIFCIGKNNWLNAQLQKIKFPPHITTTIVKFTQKIADLMAISTIIITKSGSVSFAESIYSKLPIILDGTSSILMWEQENHRFLKENNLGTIITNYNQIPTTVTHYLKHPEELKAIQKQMEQLSNNNGTALLTQVIKQMCQ